MRRYSLAIQIRVYRGDRDLLQFGGLSPPIIRFFGFSHILCVKTCKTERQPQKTGIQYLCRYGGIVYTIPTQVSTNAVRMICTFIKEKVSLKEERMDVMREEV